MAKTPDGESINAPPPAVVVVVVPFLFQSHFNQALQLAHLISTYKIPVYFATSADHCRQAKLKHTDKTSSETTHLNFIELPMPSYSCPPVDPTVRFPTHLQPCLDASLELRRPIAALLHQLSSSAKRVVVINDSYMSYTIQDVADIPTGESYSFSCISAFSLLCILNPAILDQHKGKSNHLCLQPISETVSPEIMKFVETQFPFTTLKHGDLINTCRTWEISYLDLLKDEDGNRDKKQWAVAPLNPVKVNPSDNYKINNDKCLVWLDKQPRKSVLYVSFGSTTTMKEEQVKELALGLKQSKQRFLWVLRDAERGNVSKDQAWKSGLPDGFEESVKEIGMITRDWAPQVEILAHSSVGAFMSHCGWNSCMESLSMGVPIVAWPMHSEQSYNALFVTEELKAGVVVKENWADLVGSILIKEAIEEMMSAEEGQVIRERAEEIGRVLRGAVEVGGATKVEVDSFIAHITR